MQELNLCHFTKMQELRLCHFTKVQSFSFHHPFIYRMLVGVEADSNLHDLATI